MQLIIIISLLYTIPLGPIHVHVGNHVERKRINMDGATLAKMRVRTQLQKDYRLQQLISKSRGIPPSACSGTPSL